MAGRRATRYLWYLLFLIPVLFLFFGTKMAFYRYQVRAEAVPMTATVQDYTLERYTCEDSDGNRRTCERIAYDLILDLNGDRLERPLLEANFQPGEIWHTTDMVSPDDYPRGGEMPVLVRPDLGHLVAHDSFWSAYLVPIILLGFGAFWLVGFSVVVPAMVRDG